MVAERRPDVRFVVFGREERVRPVLEKFPRVAGASQFVHCDVAVRMDDKPSQALRQGRWKSSMWKAIEAVKTGDADVCVSAGNTGALMAMSKFCLRTTASIERPAIAAIWPTIRKVAFALCRSSASRMAVVRPGTGPSSKVRTTSPRARTISWMAPTRMVRPARPRRWPGKAMMSSEGRGLIGANAIGAMETEALSAVCAPP